MFQDMVFRCYVYRDQDGQYVARCLDLLLVDVRDTMDKAIAALDESILGYLEAVGEMSTESTLIPRPYPPRQWLHFYALLISNTVKTLKAASLPSCTLSSRSG